MHANPYARYLGNHDPLKVLLATPSRIARLTRGLTRSELARRPEPDKWSIQEIMKHLAETEMVSCSRARWITFEENPTLAPFDQGKWAQAWAREKEPFGETFERFRLIRRSHVRLFKTATKQDFQRPAYHPERGALTLRIQLETIAGHDLNHLEQIERIAGELRGSRYARQREP